MISFQDDWESVWRGVPIFLREEPGTHKGCHYYGRMNRSA
jgi:hypothetical protein